MLAAGLPNVNEEFPHSAIGEDNDVELRNFGAQERIGKAADVRVIDGLVRRALFDQRRKPRLIRQPAWHVDADIDALPRKAGGTHRTRS